MTLGQGSSLWHGVTVRGDTASVSVGKNCVISDLAYIASVNKRQQGDKVVIEDNVFVGPNASLDACQLESFSYVGMGASIGRGSVVESFAVVAAGAKVPEGVTVPSGQIWAGSPAHYLRDLTQEEKHIISESNLEMQQLAQIYNEETEKSYREILDSKDKYIKYMRADFEDKAEDKLAEFGLPQTHEDLDYIEHRVYHDYVGTVDYDIPDPNHSYGSETKTWIPYEQDLTHYPEVFHQYQENYKRWDEVKTKFENEPRLKEQGESPFTRKLPKDMSPWEAKYDMIMPKYNGSLCQ